MSDWSCEAYSPDAAVYGALCFFSPPGERTCADSGECRRRMGPERQRVFDRIHERAAEGAPDFVYLAQTFTSPEQLLGGSEDASDSGADERDRHVCVCRHHEELHEGGPCWGIRGYDSAVGVPEECRCRAFRGPGGDTGI